MQQFCTFPRIEHANPPQGTGQQIQSANSYVNKAVAVAKELTAFSKAAQKMADDGKTLNVIEDALASMTFLTKLSVGLQCVSVGLSVLQIFLPVKSQQTKILEGVGEIIGRVSVLQNSLDAKFNQVSLEVNIAAQKAALLHDMSQVEAATIVLDDIKKLHIAGKSTDSKVADLVKFGTTDFMTILREIGNVVTGSGVASNLLADLYTKSYGDIDVVWPIGEYLAHQAQLCVILIGAIKGYEEKLRVTAVGGTFDNDQAVAVAQSVADDYDDTLALIGKSVKKYCHECIDSTARREQIKRYIQNNKSGTMLVVEGDMQGSADRLASGLRKKMTLFQLCRYCVCASFRFR